MVRAGSLSDARVVALLSTHFIPCISSALNTPQHISSPADAELLAKCAGKQKGTFFGGEREAFLLPDGTMQRVFLSLHGPDERNGCVQMTAKGRRSEDAVWQFKAHAERALIALHGELPADWDAIWEGKHESVKALREAGPSWPVPKPGTAALRAFVTNSYRQYDQLLGCELVAAGELKAQLVKALAEPDARLDLDRDTLVALGRAVVPRGQVGTKLLPESITGRVTFVVESCAGARVQGRIEGELALVPKTRAEVGLRDSAVTRFSHESRIEGSFVLEAGTVRELRLVSRDVKFDWITGHPKMSFEFAPAHEFAVEWVE